MKNSTWATTYLLRKTSMSLGEIRSLTLNQLWDLLTEVQYQESLDDYKTDNRLANILATIANTVPRRPAKTYKSTDFLKGRPQRKGEKNAVEDEKEILQALSKRFGIKLPGREIKDM